MAEQGTSLRIGDGSRWSFFNGRWADDADGEIAVPEDLRRQDGPAMQGHHYAFYHEYDYGDFSGRLQFSLGSHSDAGIIIHAHAANDFYLLHFPECGQANRAQHFWAALSRMDGGWLRVVRMDCVRRVASTNNLLHEAEMHLVADRLSVRIDGTGVFEAADAGLRGYGSAGLYLFGGAGFRNVRFEGRTRPPRAWDDGKEPTRRWFHPSAETKYGRWQRPGQVIRSPDAGELIHTYTVQERPYSGAVTQLLSRSTDKGRTWSEPTPAAHLRAGAWEGWGALHLFPDGAPRLVVGDENGFGISASQDAGRTWAEPTRTSLPPTMPGVKRLHLPPAPFVNLRDGSLVVFAYGGHDSTLPDAPIQMWGSHHCQAFAARSSDNGRTWSDWANVDGTHDGEGNFAGGNLDLTEVSGAQTTTGAILALVRPIFSPWMWETRSTDGGRSWTPCMRGPFPGYAPSNLLRTSSGALLIAHRLPGCCVHVSLDDGETWDGGTMIDSAIWVMGCMVEVEPDLVLYVYWDSFESLMRAQFIRVTPHGIEPSDTVLS